MATPALTVSVVLRWVGLVSFLAAGFAFDAATFGEGAFLAAAGFLAGALAELDLGADFAADLAADFVEGAAFLLRPLAEDAGEDERGITTLLF